MVLMGIIMNSNGAINNVTKNITLNHQESIDVEVVKGLLQKVIDVPDKEISMLSIISISVSMRDLPVPAENRMRNLQI
jgi:hypothetical protein